MPRHALDFEQPVVELETKIEELRLVENDSEINISEEIARLEQKCTELSKSIFSRLTPWQVVQMARHPARPRTLDYIKHMFTEFDELQGDRHYSSAPAIVGGIARLDNEPVMVIGHEKGVKTKEKVYRNFGMAKPEDYRKALRLMEMAEKFSLPIISFIDTSGAYPGVDAEEHNQSEAIARNLFVMSQLKVPIICTIIGEGGSGGALAIGIGDRLLMLEYSVYSVISPEGCASILWKSAEKAPDAALAMGMTAQRLYELGLTDQVISEPLGGAHRNVEEMTQRLKEVLVNFLGDLKKIPPNILVQKRYDRLMAIGI